MASRYLDRLKALDSLDLRAVTVVGDDLREAIQRIDALENESASSLELAEQVKVQSQQIERLKQKLEYARAQHQKAIDAQALTVEQLRKQLARVTFAAMCKRSADRFAKGKISYGALRAEWDELVEQLRAADEEAATASAIVLNGAADEEDFDGTTVLVIHRGGAKDGGPDQSAANGKA